MVKARIYCNITLHKSFEVTMPKGANESAMEEVINALGEEELDKFMDMVSRAHNKGDVRDWEWSSDHIEYDLRKED